MTDFAAQAIPSAMPPLRRISIAQARPRDDWRLVLVIFAFLLAYGAVALRMGLMALAEPEEPRIGRSSGAAKPVRGEIVDRDGALLAANLPAWSLYAHPQEMTDPETAAEGLGRLFGPEVGARMESRLTGEDRFVWVRSPITPREKQAVLELGQPGLYFGRREMRIYPAGRVAAHLLGGVKTGVEDVSFAELVGAGGTEGFFDRRLRDPAEAGEPLALSIDLDVQAALTAVLAEGVARYDALGASAVLMEAQTGAVRAMVSLPDFDPNLRPDGGAGTGEADPRFNRAAQGRYELGSTFKVLTAAIALELGVAEPDTLIETGQPLAYGRQRIRDLHRMPAQMTVTDIVRRSSNVGTARLALRIGTRRFKEYLEKLGLFDPTGIELKEAARARPLLPGYWSDLSTMTISFGHGLAASPLHLAAAYAAVVNGGFRVYPSLMKDGRPVGPRILSEETSAAIRDILRVTARRGTGRRADVPGYEVGGKTGTAEKVRPEGGYYEDKVISTFAAAFPMSRPKYVLIVSLDEPTDPASGKREASRTAVPTAGEAIRRVAPLLDLRPIASAPAPRHLALPVGFPD